MNPFFFDEEQAIGDWISEGNPNFDIPSPFEDQDSKRPKNGPIEKNSHVIMDESVGPTGGPTQKSSKQDQQSSTTKLNDGQPPIAMSERLRKMPFVVKMILLMFALKVVFFIGVETFHWHREVTHPVYIFFPKEMEELENQRLESVELKPSQPDEHDFVLPAMENPDFFIGQKRSMKNDLDL